MESHDQGMTINHNFTIFSLHKKMANVGPNANNSTRIVVAGVRSPVIITNFWGGLKPSMDWFSRENWNRKTPYLLGKSMVSCRFPLINGEIPMKFQIDLVLLPFPGFRCRSRVRALQCPLHRAASNQKAPAGENVDSIQKKAGTWNCRQEIRINLRHAIGIHRIFLASWFLHAQVFYFADVMWQIQCHSHHPSGQTWLGVILNHSISRAIPSGNLT